jgi:glycerol-3-phosphate acyltransferase PlsX
VRYLLKESLKSTISSKVGFMLSRRAFEDFKKRLDYAEYGGAPLLGLKGVCIVGHGSSNSTALKNAIRVAAQYADTNINDKIEKGLSSGQARRPAPAGDGVGAGTAPA